MLPSCYDKNGNIIDFYTIFNLPGTAGPGEIKSAFRDLIKRYHPDTASIKTDNLTEKLDLIIRGYRILIDDDLRMEYDRILFHSRKVDGRGYAIISKKRIKYSATLGEMLKARLMPKGMKHNDILYNFGQDIEIFITPFEARKGALAYIELPARMTCPLCMGSHSRINDKCHVCNGVGRIHTTSQLEVQIPPHVDDTTYIDVDLTRIRPDKLTSFNVKNLRIKITILENRQ
ncbi:MAG TPA: DnaJ domain-containing protein [Spirochaetota bacterium]|nr:DnaJ domain-containing protein [Spirochaetota bacterium]HPC40433.1 DnaJ domain-containing protein [Spirochaetota bacterium]HPL19066.1 DnaJ domain-containing protein [Spirochaetota bacterium]HQF06500.1 DnaJ domain-containing protein [Spirochaetota bacterium]HQH98085.1 DnaJ domain-containing protein [Spirochaetota bacterium]